MENAVIRAQPLWIPKSFPTTLKSKLPNYPHGGRPLEFGCLHATRATSPDMSALVRTALALLLLMACQPKADPNMAATTTASGGSQAGGIRGSGSGGSAGSATPAGTGGAATGGGTGEGAAGGAGTGGMITGGGSGGAIATGGASGSAGGSGGSSGGAGGGDARGDVRTEDAPVDKPGGDVYPESDHLPNRPDIRLCKKEWTPEQCCAFLCSCLNSICADSAKAKPGLATCMNWCPKISNMARRCHVYHCYISISPTGGIKDHDSHCGHAANEVAGGSCPAVVHQ